MGNYEKTTRGPDLGEPTQGPKIGGQSRINDVVDCEACDGTRVTPDGDVCHKPEPDDPERDRWLAECAKECRCCPRCRTHPCGGLTAGGVCDDLDCDCGQNDPGFYEVGPMEPEDEENW